MRVNGWASPGACGQNPRVYASGQLVNEQYGFQLYEVWFVLVRGPPSRPAPTDFAGWSEVFLGGRWYVVDPRNLCAARGPRPHRPGRDAADVAITTTFGPNDLQDFRVWADEVGTTSSASGR